LPRAVAERALPSLLGMAVDFAPGLRGHDVRRKIGVITRAEIAGDRLEVAGYLFGKDFPEIVREIRARRERLGMSYEVSRVRVADPSVPIWMLEEIVFTGAAILERTAAAYQTTSLAATVAGTKQGDTMDEKMIGTLELLAQRSQALAEEFAGLRTLVAELGRAQERLAEVLDRRGTGHPAGDLETRVEELARASEELRKQNEALRAQAERFSAQVTRKTVSPQVLTLLAKSGVHADVIGRDGQIDVVVLDKALDGLPVEQRIAVKSQLARAGAIE